jgi:hypothetical protein
VLHTEVFGPSRFQRVDPAVATTGDAVWFGLGLCGEALSRGLPVDVLALLTAQELLRRALGLRRSLVLVADSNAVAVGHPRAAVEAVADRAEDTLHRLGAVLDLPFECVRGSAVATWREAAGLDASSPYEAHQLAQMEAMRRAGASVKLGWVMPGSHRDERYFDRLYRERVGGSVAFAYAVCGRALDPRRPRACPYVATRPDRRLVIGTGESVRAKLHAAHQYPREVAGYRRLLRRIGRGLARLRGTPTRCRPEQSLQRILDRAEALEGGRAHGAAAAEGG